MTVRTIDYHDGRIETYDDRFVCQWHLRWNNGDEYVDGMGWCGLDCPTQRYRVGMDILKAMEAEHELPLASPYFEQVRQWAKSQEAAT